jgi:short-subunit dehydrogenase
MNIWITGASTGIGRELARQYAEAGHIVYATARGLENLNSLADECKDYRGQVIAAPADVTNSDALKQAYQAACATGVPDLVVLNAGTHKPTSATKFVLADHLKLMEINYNGVLTGLDTILPSFLERGSGQIAVVASVAGYRGLPKAGAYGASKAALINLCESMQPELKAQGVDLRLICPGFVKTPLTDKNKFPMPFLMPVKDAVAAMINGLESRRFQIVFPWRMSVVMQILRRMPNRLFLGLSSKISG